MKTKLFLGLGLLGRLGLPGLIAGVLTSCMSGQNQTTLDEISGAANAAVEATVVEAFVDYRGPQERWAATPEFVLHVTAKGTEAPEIVVPPAWTQQMGTTSETRRPAQVLTGEEARAKMGQLAVAIQEKDAGFSGCMYPVHVRLIKSDGAVMDQQGCRGQSTWAKAASETVDFFMASVVAAK